MVKVVYNERLVYKVVIWVFGGNLFMEREGSFKEWLVKMLLQAGANEVDAKHIQ